MVDEEDGEPALVLVSKKCRNQYKLKSEIRVIRGSVLISAFRFQHFSFCLLSCPVFKHCPVPKTVDLASDRVKSVTFWVKSMTDRVKSVMVWVKSATIWVKSVMVGVKSVTIEVK
jgi:hypothetical protein